MLAQEVSQAPRAKRGVTVMRKLKKDPHRITYMPEGRLKEIISMSQKGQQLTIDPTGLPIDDRISNESFTVDEKRDEEVIEVIDAPEISIES